MQRYETIQSDKKLLASFVKKKKKTRKRERELKQKKMTAKQRPLERKCESKGEINLN